MQLNGNRQFIIPINMKKTIHVNIGGMPFVLDEDAYDVLKRYLSEIEIRLDGVDDQETMQDIETRIADIFSGAISPRMQVVDTALVKRAMAVIGPARSSASRVGACRTRTDMRPERREASVPQPPRPRRRRRMRRHSRILESRRDIAAGADGAVHRFRGRPAGLSGHVDRHSERAALGRVKRMGEEVIWAR